MKVITVHSAKGGVGKTTSSLSIANILAEQGFKTLLVDLDPQFACTRHMAAEYDLGKTVRQVLLRELSILVCSINPYPNLVFCPGQLRLQNIERELADETNPIFIINDILDSIRNDFDYCVFDTQPNTGLLTRAALVASHHVIIPCLLEAWPIESLEISFELIEKTTQAQKYLDTRLETINIVPTFYEERRQLTEAFHNALKESYAEYLTHTVIHRSVEVAKTYSTPGARLENSMRAKYEYTNLIKEIEGENSGI